MIDTHCHLEQENYSRDRDEVIARCKESLDAVITSCAHPKDWQLTMQLVEQYPNFVYATASIHPEYIEEISDKEIEDYIETIKNNKAKIVAVGESGLDYNWVKSKEGRERQRELFECFIELAKELQLPIIVHARNGQDDIDAVEECIKILERHVAKHVQMHMFTSRHLLQRVLSNSWMVSVNTLLMRSKSVRKIVRDCPLERLMLETDAPWLAVAEDGTIKEPHEKRNEPTVVKLVAEKITEIKKLPVKEIDRVTTENAIRFFKLPVG